MDLVLGAARLAALGIQYVSRRVLGLLLKPAARILGVGSDHTRILKTAFGCAAARALESERPDALFIDPLARFMAGEEAINDFLARHSSLDDASAPGSARPAYFTVIRTKYIDTVVLAVTGSCLPMPNVSAVTEWLHEMGVGSISQVVLLGSGIDARPWRLDLRDGVQWFEVDQSAMVMAKRRLLLKAKAGIGPEGHHRPRFPLKAEKWVAVSSDVETLSFLHKLERRGLRMGEPVLWVLEGLIVYLKPKLVPRFLRALNQRCGVGSVMVVSLIMATSDSLRRRETWKWGCPENHVEFFRGCGWEVVSWIPISAAYEMFGCRSTKPSHLTLAQQPKFLVARRIE